MTPIKRDLKITIGVQLLKPRGPILAWIKSIMNHHVRPKVWKEDERHLGFLISCIRG